MTAPETTSDTPLPEKPSRQQSSFASDVLKLVSGTTFAQLLGILASPLLTRLYGPEAFGILAIFMAITSVLGVVACLRYEMAIMLPESDEAAANLLGLSLLFTLLVSLLTVPVVWWGSDLLLGWLNAPGLAPYVWLVPPVIFVAGVFLALNFWNSRTKHFGRLSAARVSQATATTSAKVGLGVAGFATSGAMIGATIGGQVLATVVLSGQIWRDDGKFFVQHIRWRSMLAELRRYKKFPLINTWSALFNVLSMRSPEFLLTVLFSTTTVGFFILGQRLLSLPATLVGQAIGRVFLQRVSRARFDGSMATLVENMLRRLLLISAFPFALLLVIAPEIFALVFGEEWLTAGMYVQVLIPWWFLSFVMAPLSMLIPVMEKQGVGLAYNIVLFVTRVAALVIGGILGSPILALALFSLSGALLLGFLCVYTAGLAGLRAGRVLQIIVSTMLWLACIAPIIFLKWVFAVPGLVLLMCGAGLAIIYYAVVIARDQQIRTIVLNALHLKNRF